MSPIQFKKHGIHYLETLSEDELVKILRAANRSYRNSDKPILTDHEYDIIHEFIARKHPSNPVVTEMIPVSKRKAQLPYPMGSMNKIKPDTNALHEWMKKYKGPYLISCKLDGVSGLYSTEGDECSLFTRGDGKVGQDVKHFIPHLRLPTTRGTVLRGEFIINKKTFQEKYKKTFANARNLVSGIMNKVTIDDKINDVDFVVYEVIKPVMKPSDQMRYLETLGVKSVISHISDISNELLSNLLIRWRSEYRYDMDGLVVVDDKIYERKPGNPDHAFAFKMMMTDQMAEATVVDVIWTPSKDGYLKPRVRIEPIHINGVTIEYATGFNAAFIRDHKIGVGAVVRLIRSGDVIPHIQEVTHPATITKMPHIPYIWNDTGVDVLLEDIASDRVVQQKVITGFFRGIGVDGLSDGITSRIMEAGYDSVEKMIKMSRDDFLKIEGFQDRLSTKIFTGIREKLASATLLTLMSASNMFGRGLGEKKMSAILEQHPDILFTKDITKVLSVKGMADKSANAFVEGIPPFVDFLQRCGLMDKLETVPSLSQTSTSTSHPLYNKSIVMTGFRDEKIKKLVMEAGGSIGSGVTKNTFIVITKDIEQSSGKIAEAKRLNIPIMTCSEFFNQFLNKK
jgi:NAD-dependent DNA ligase